MRNVFTLLALTTFLCTCVRAQEAYFQQDVSYEIDVRLDDRTHTLHGKLTVEYTNNSPVELDNIWFHLWPNAYANTETAYARQELRQGSTRFYFSEKANRGGIDSLDFAVAGKPLKMLKTDDPDVVSLRLEQAVQPGETVTITTPFRVKIPASFSRLGHVGESYQMTQWYPKPAVYDRNGWHAMPYLDQGEFYSEFGDFTVRITLPENYVVGATGVLQEADERQKMLERAARDRAELAGRNDLSTGYVPEPFPASSATMKTLTYQAEGVHDFAWFADKRFKVLHDTLQLGGAAGAENGIEERGTVDVWALFTETEAALWQDATDYLKRSTRFYSEHVGRYPYPQVTGLQSALSAGGGMEYPMVTVIGRNRDTADLDEVLAHEVGHNWFYGVLGSNERDHPWMDEGINSYYEQRYMEQFYPGRTNEQPLVGAVDFNRLGYRMLARLGKDLPPDTRSDSLVGMQYWIGAYSKPALAMQELEQYIGRDSVDRAMRAYYEQWKFKHPQPEDFFAAMETQTERTLLPWFAEGFMTDKVTDWKRIPGPSGIYVNRGQRNSPQPDGFEDAPVLDLFPKDNLAQRRKTAFSFATAQEDPAVRNLFYLPLAGYNLNDGLQLGAALHNRTLEPREFEWMVAPMFSLGSSRLTGFAGVEWQKRPLRKEWQLVKLAAGFQRWSDFTLARTDVAYDYSRFGQTLELVLDHAPITERSSSVTVQNVLVSQRRPRFSGDTIPSGTTTRRNLFYRLGYQSSWDRELNPFAFSVNLEYKFGNDRGDSGFDRNHLRLDAELTGAKQYERDKFVRWRFFGGVFLANPLRESSFTPNSALSLVDNAASDYRYDGLYLGRNAPIGNWTEQQLGRRQGGFRAPISPAFSFGRSNSYLTALNLDVDLPLKESPIPLLVWVDAGYYGARATSSEPLRGQFAWVGGAGLAVADGRVGLYLPLVADPDTRDLLEQRGNLLSRLSFRLNLEGWVPWRWVDGFL